MSSKSTKAKRKAIPGTSLKELIDAGVVDEFYHLQDSVDMPPFRITRHPYLPELPKRLKEGGSTTDDSGIEEKPDGRP